MRAHEPPVRMFTSARLDPLAERSIRALARAEDVVRIAIMPDVHPSHADPRQVCVGTVLATSRLAYPAAVGGDIGCGILVAAFNVDAEAVRIHGESILARLAERVPTERHRRDATPFRGSAGTSSVADLGPAAPRPETLSVDALVRLAGAIETSQLGTLGGGNHFLELQRDVDDRVWVMIHSGSRAMGQAIRTAHLDAASMSPSTEASARGPMCGLDVTTERGAAYLADQAWARQWASANRHAMLIALTDVLASHVGIPLARLLDAASVRDCDHNHVRRETHDDRELLIHRKGAQSAALDEPGAIPGSMGTFSLHTRGLGHPDALRSCSHGAGRAMTRDAARRRISPQRLREELGTTIVPTRALRALCAEAPSAYRPLDRVMRDQQRLVREVRRLRPLLCWKGWR